MSVRTVIPGDRHMGEPAPSTTLDGLRPARRRGCAPARAEVRALVARARVAAGDSGEPLVADLLAAAERALDEGRRQGPVQLAAPEPAVPATRLAGLMLGPFRLYQDGALLQEWQSCKGLRIAKYLLAHPRPVPREQLLELLWPEVDPEVGRRNLHQAIYGLRRALRRRQPELHHILFENDCYVLNPDVEMWCDTPEFEVRVAEGRRLGGEGRPEQAVDAYGAAELLYRGEYLEDTPCEEWALAPREYLADCHAGAMRGLAELNLALGRIDESIGAAWRLLLYQPADELAHQLVIRGHLAAGRRGDALRQYRSCARALHREFGFSPSAETQSLCGPLGVS
jgi:LuxR family maltose regulon positive regulatory protein